MSLPASATEPHKNNTLCLINGVQALARLPAIQRQRDAATGLNTAGFISGYRGSPLGGLDQALWKNKAELKTNHIHFQPGINEELAATAIWGSQQVNLFEGAKYDGVFGMWYGKGPGVDRSGDVFRHANSAGTSQHGGVLAIAGDDHASRSSSLAHQTEQVFQAVMMPTLAPADVQEYLDYGIHGWAMSRYSGCWVALKAVADTVESGAVVDVDPWRVETHLPEDLVLPEQGLGIRWPDPPLDQEARLAQYKLRAAQAYARANRLDRVTFDAPEARLGIVTSGKSYLDVCQALDSLGIDAEGAKRLGLRVYKVGMVWPLEPDGIRRFASGLDEIIVVEEKRAFLEQQLKEVLFSLEERARPRVVGKTDGSQATADHWLLPECGELSYLDIAGVLVARLLEHREDTGLQARLDALLQRRYAPGQLAASGMQRVPHYCSGCPHNTSTKVPEGSRALAGIGCHFMAAWIYPETQTFSQMGGEGAAWIGQAPFTETRHVFANLGDGTYFHSGLLAIRAAVAAKAPITYKILYNDAVAMTGGQPVDGTLTVPQISQQLAAEGVKRIIVVSDDTDKYAQISGLADGVPVRHRSEMEAIQRELRDYPGVSAIIYDQTCAAEKRRRRKRKQYPDPPRRVMINEAVCEGCGDCSRQSNCMSVVSVETEFGAKRVIDQSSCNKDFSCLDGFCPSFVTVEGGQLRKGSPAYGTPAADALPTPALASLDAPYNILITGIGGTGVVTIGTLLGLAAHQQGLGVVSLDMTGMAQKGGAVWSHVRLARTQEALHAPRIGPGETDLLIGGDLVVSADDETLSKLQSERTSVVLNLAESITSTFIRRYAQQATSGDLEANPDPRFESERMYRRLVERVGQTGLHSLDASTLATRLIGDSIATNTFLLGVAYQKELLPFSESTLLEAIETLGTAVDFNKASFQWGRRAAHDLEEVERLTRQQGATGPQPGLSRTLDEVIERRQEQLTAYQDAAYAKRYTDKVQRIRNLEKRLQPHAIGLTEAVARHYFKLLAYKDEYEVARLYSDPKFMEKIHETFEGDFKLNFQLAPPLWARGKAGDPPRKRSYGPWMMKAFKLLARLKFLRQTPLDPFGHTHDRKLERTLLKDYERLLDTLEAELTAENHPVAVKLAALPDRIRGFGPVKERYAQHAQEMQQQLLRDFRNLKPSIQKIDCYEVS
ncbi:MAG: indolepyruvate ferredoxin oxidoreductase family protein [Halomonas sp. BM-2019]|nr:MAG: indolepyruvate ferredoxin oxidoreductase family protein [Halomonas sp. BM-2019]